MNFFLCSLHLCYSRTKLNRSLCQHCARLQAQQSAHLAQELLVAHAVLLAQVTHYVQRQSRYKVHDVAVQVGL